MCKDDNHSEIISVQTRNTYFIHKNSFYCCLLGVGNFNPMKLLKISILYLHDTGYHLEANFVSDI